MRGNIFLSAGLAVVLMSSLSGCDDQTKPVTCTSDTQSCPTSKCIGGHCCNSPCASGGRNLDGTTCHVADFCDANGECRCNPVVVTTTSGSTGGSTNGTGATSAGSSSGGSTSGTTGGATTGGSTGGGTTNAGATSTGTSGGTTSTTSAGTTGGGKADGAVCGGDSDCTSGRCGSNHSTDGHCCGSACSSDGICGVSDCDATGACNPYPVATTACGSTCLGSTVTKSACDGLGACVAGTPTPCDPYVCGATGACLANCAKTTECVTGYYCFNSTSTCLLQQDPGTSCSKAEVCKSGVCDVGGFGNCCASACSTAGDPLCAATYCEPKTGACHWQPNTVSCRALSCKGSIVTEAADCDGAGGCPAVVTTDCKAYACDPIKPACYTSCATNGNCAKGGYCDLGTQTCCSNLAASGSLYVDAVTGSDTTTCCGDAMSPCQTLTHAMVLIDAAQAQDVTIYATVSGGGGDWSATETWPVTLGWGVELNAPGVFFLDPFDPNAPVPAFSTFEITSYSLNDKVGYASIVGAAGNPVGVGMDSANTQQTGDNYTISVVKGALYIANASVNGSVDSYTSQGAILVYPGASLYPGQDQSGGVSGTLTIGNTLGAEATDGNVGIYCSSDQKISGCTIQDFPVKGQPSLVIQGQETGDIVALDFASITLTGSPVIGAPPSALGFKNCPQKNDAINGNPAVWLNGQATVKFSNGTVQCVANAGFLLQPSQYGFADPTLTLDNTVIQNTEVGIWAQAGTTIVTNSTLNYNVIGVEQDNGSIDLSGGGNTVICSSGTETVQSFTVLGIDVYNTSTANLNASNVVWDTANPDYFDCDFSFSCTCNIASCTTTPGSDDMDAVEDSTNLGGITLKGAAQAKNGCN